MLAVWRGHPLTGSKRGLKGRAQATLEGQTSPGSWRYCVPPSQHLLSFCLLFVASRQALPFALPCHPCSAPAATSGWSPSVPWAMQEQGTIGTQGMGV